VTPKLPSDAARRRGLYPHVAAALVNLAAVGLLLAPLGRGLDTATTVVVASCAAGVAGVNAFALARLWRRVYRRHASRVPIEVAASVAAEGVALEQLGRTDDVSFGGASITLGQAVARGARVTVRLLGAERLSVEGTVVFAAGAPDGRHRIGVRFDALDVEDEHRLLVLLLQAAIGGRDERPAQPAAVLARDAA
jgi:hypothetical protein